jgi:hypothetical protein
LRELVYVQLFLVVNFMLILKFYGECGSAVVETLRYKLVGHGFDTR